MTLTIDIAPATEAQLQQAAQQRGLSVEQVAAAMLDDLLQDQADAADAESILDATRPEEYLSWEQLKAEVGL